MKTTVYLPEDFKSALGRLATERERSEAELIREANRRLVEDSEPPRSRLPLFSSGDPTLAEGVDEVLCRFRGAVFVLDTSGLLAAIDSSQRFDDAAKEALDGAVEPLILSPFVLAELDYLLATRAGREGPDSPRSKKSHWRHTASPRSRSGTWTRQGG